MGIEQWNMLIEMLKHNNKFIDDHCPYKVELTKTESRLKMMEISFEQINNSRNDLIKQLSEQEILNEKLLKDLGRS